jgi:YfiH family protein
VLDLLDAGLSAPARGVFSTRLGGTSAPPYDALNVALHTEDDWDRVHANRDLLARALGLSYRDLVFGRQVHGAGVRLVTASSSRARDRGLPDTDGLVTTTPGLALVMMGADCPPVLLAGDGVVGVAHVGRPGLAAGVLPEVLRVMREQGATQISARIGPGICGRCYEVPEELADEVEARAPGSRGTTRRGTPSVDLAAGARRQLEDAGVDGVSEVGGCTLEQPDRFFSYRRDGRTGRHAGVVWLT